MTHNSAEDDKHLDVPVSIWEGSEKHLKRCHTTILTSRSWISIRLRRHAGVVPASNRHGNRADEQVERTRDLGGKGESREAWIAVRAAPCLPGKASH
jgi:hypothetical protein